MAKIVMTVELESKKPNFPEWVSQTLEANVLQDKRKSGWDKDKESLLLTWFVDCELSTLGKVRILEIKESD